MKTQTLRLFIMILGTIFLYTAAPAHAAFLTFDLDPFTGDPAHALITVDDNAEDFFTVNVQVLPETHTGNIGDITGVFFNLSDQIRPGHITTLIGAPFIGFENMTRNLGGGVNLNGGGPNNPGLFDVGLRYEGFNVDDVQEIEFTISKLSGLTLHDFTAFGLRLQTVGPLGGNRSGSSKLSGSDPVPIPGSVWLLGSALIGIVGFRRKIPQLPS